MGRLLTGNSGPKPLQSAGPGCAHFEFDRFSVRTACVQYSSVVKSNAVSRGRKANKKKKTILRRVSDVLPGKQKTRRQTIAQQYARISGVVADDDKTRAVLSDGAVAAAEGGFEF